MAITSLRPRTAPTRRHVNAIAPQTRVQQLVDAVAQAQAILARAADPARRLYRDLHWMLARDQRELDRLQAQLSATREVAHG